MKNDLSSHSLEKFIKKILETQEVIPGFGHAVLRVTDPRFLFKKTVFLELLK